MEFGLNGYENKIKKSIDRFNSIKYDSNLIYLRDCYSFWF